MRANGEWDGRNRLMRYLGWGYELSSDGPISWRFFQVVFLLKTQVLTSLCQHLFCSRQSLSIFQAPKLPVRQVWNHFLCRDLHLCSMNFE